MDTAAGIALAGGLAWGSGLRLYAMVFAAGLLSRLGYLDLPATLRTLEHPVVMAVAGVLLVVEFLADKIPAVDSLWDSVHTFIRIPAGAILAALALGEHDPAVAVIAGLLGGTLAAGTHFAKAGVRAMANTSPEPFSNIALSVAEDLLAAVGLAGALVYPLGFLLFLVFFVLVLAWLLPRLLKGILAVFRRPAGPPH
jgi:hypothetical protein